MHIFAYCLSYVMWSVWIWTEGVFLPSGTVAAFIMDTALKGLIWVGPMLPLLKCSDNHWLVHPDQMLCRPFPWYATFLGLCLTAVFLHTAHIVLVGIDVWGIFDPLWIGLSLAAAVIEEITFRGFLFNRQATSHSTVKAAVVNGLLFSIYHYPEFLLRQNFSALFGFRFWIIAVMGVVFSLGFARWKHLGMTIVIHFVWNMLCFWFALA